MDLNGIKIHFAKGPRNGHNEIMIKDVFNGWPF